MTKKKSITISFLRFFCDVFILLKKKTPRSFTVDLIGQLIGSEKCKHILDLPGFPRISHWSRVARPEHFRLHLQGLKERNFHYPRIGPILLNQHLRAD